VHISPDLINSRCSNTKFDPTASGATSDDASDMTQKSYLQYSRATPKITAMRGENNTVLYPPLAASIILI